MAVEKVEPEKQLVQGPTTADGVTLCALEMRQMLVFAWHRLCHLLHDSGHIDKVSLHLTVSKDTRRRNSVRVFNQGSFRKWGLGGGP